MQIGGQRAFKALRQPTTMSTRNSHDIATTGGMEGQKLIFLYPFLIDNNLFKYGNKLRDFFAIQLVSKIKEQNALDISVDSIKNVGSIGQGKNAVNPAEYIRKSLWHSNDLNPQSYGADSWVSQEYRMMYQEKLNQFHEFIKNQIKYDPRYKGFNPIVSSITISNLLQLSLVVGTKSYSIDTVFIYWILITSIGYDIPLTSQANINKIFNIMENIPSQNYLSLITSDKEQKRINNLIGATADSPGQNTSSRIQGKFKNTPAPTTSWSKSGKPNNRKGYLSKDGQTGLSSTRARMRHAKYRMYASLNNSQKIKLNSFMKGERSKSALFFSLVLDPSRWYNEVGGLETRSSLTIDNLSILTKTRAKHYDRAITSFSSYVENVIVPILHGLDTLTGPQPAGVNIAMKIRGFLDQIGSISDSDGAGLDADYLQLANMVFQDISSANTISGNDTLERIADLCEQNADITRAIESNISKVMPNLNLQANFDGAALSKFIKSVSLLADQLDSKSKFFDMWINEITKISNKQYHNLIRSIEATFENIVYDLLRSEYPPIKYADDSRGVTPWIDGQTNSTPESLADRYYNFKTNICDLEHQPNATNCVNAIYDAIITIQNSITRILIFFFKWNFFSYTCDYVHDIEIDVEIQRKDALDFPNYCIVLPIDLIKGLYSIIVTRNFKKMMASSDLSDIKDIQNQDFMMNTGNVKRVITLVNQRLKIPNIMIIDEVKKECWFQFMFDTQPIKVNFSSIDNYISHQNDILQVF